MRPSSSKSRTHNWLDDTGYEQAWDGVADSAHDEQAWSGAAASADATDDAETKTNVVDKAKPDDAETAMNVVDTPDDADTELKSALATLQAVLKNVGGAKVSLNVTLNSGEPSTQQRTPRASRWFFSKWWIESMKSVLSIGASGPAGPPLIIR